MRTMLSSGSTTLVCPERADHLALAGNVIQGSVNSSSPKYHVHPVGSLVEVPLNCTVKGAIPEVSLAVKATAGEVAAGVTVM